MNNTLRAGLEVLETLWAMQAPLGVSELARGLGRDKGNVHRVLTTLAAHGFVHQDAGSRKYQLGSAWAQRFDASLRAPALPMTCRADVAAAWIPAPTPDAGQATLASSPPAQT